MNEKLSVALLNYKNVRANLQKEIEKTIESGGQINSLSELDLAKIEIANAVLESNDIPTSIAISAYGDV